MIEFSCTVLSEGARVKMYILPFSQ